MKKRILLLAAVLLLGGCTNNNNVTSTIVTTTPNPTTITAPSTTTTDDNTTSLTASTPAPTTPTPTTPTPTTPTPSTPTPSTPTPSTPTPSTPTPTTPIPTTPVVVELAKPSLIIDNETGVVSWNEIATATHYNYIINDGEIQTTTSNTITLEDKSNISVQAANSESVSKWSNAVTYYDTSDIIIENKEDIKVYFHGTSYEPLLLKEGDLVSKPADPTKEFYTFDNWYADPFHEQLFDFNKPVYENTIIYASYNKDVILDNVYFWIKANDLLTSSNQQFWSGSSWKFIPLQLNVNQNSFKEYKATVTVTGASSSTPAAFVIMDGFSADDGRNYWKNGDSDFTISSDGTYDIYFSAEHEYQASINASIVASNNTAKTLNAIEIKNTLSTPIVNVDVDNNIARWDEVSGATEYEVILNNLAPTTTTNNYISLEKRTHISVRAINESETSSWSVPKANIATIYEEPPVKTHAYVYFLESGLDALEVELNTEITAPNNPTLENATFEGWYLDVSLKTKATFPFIVTDNTVFYPKWNYANDILTKEYYVLTDSSGNKVKGLTWNLDNYDFYEYETGKVSLTANVNYYIKRLDGTKSWGPYTVNTNGSYKIYFSEEHLWAVGTEKERNIYIESTSATIYFTNNWKWSGTIYAYVWNLASDTPKKSWPGEAMEVAKTNSYGETIYKIQVDLESYDMIIFNNNNDKQTVDLSLSGAYSGLGFYISGGSGKEHTTSTYDYK